MAETKATTDTNTQTSVINSSSIEIPAELLPGIFKKIAATSVVAGLSGATPMTFGDINNLVFTSEPRAEFVGEGVAKNPATATFSNIVGVPHKFTVSAAERDSLVAAGWRAEGTAVSAVQ